MRLLNKTTLEMAYFADVDEAPPYIILSHRWVGAETSMQEFNVEKHHEPDQWSAGVKKVIAFCKEARSHAEDWVWVDTCCIDKTNSAELQESINSMYRWYEKAALCIVYLEDIDTSGATGVALSDETRQSLQESPWFTRGWTLQELLSPKEQWFVDKHWKIIGQRSALAEVIEEITSISPEYFGNPDALHAAPVAVRMSWLSQRKTTRVEDLAYCALGIFDINMTMLYGEGSKAFQRLQREIIREIEDDSILLWLPTEDIEENTSVPVLAPSPACFAFCKGQTIKKSIFFHRTPHRWTVAGLEVELYDYRMSQFGSQLTVVLNCTFDGRRVCFDLHRTESEATGQGNRWHRSGSKTVESVGRNYPAPPTAHDEYMQQKQNLMMGGGTSRFGAGAGAGGMGHGPQGNFMHAGQLANQYGMEKIRHKVFIA